MNQLGLIGASGLVAPSQLQTTIQDLSTPYGEASGPIVCGQMGQHNVIFVPRQGTPRRYAPNQVNYRANIWKLKALGAQSILATNCVGAINPEIVPSEVVVPDQLIDYTYGRDQSFEDEDDAHTGHFDFTEPFDEDMRMRLIEAVEAAGEAEGLRRQGCYAVTQGPRFETRAEIKRCARDGCDIVGMSLMPEAALARQAGIAYASLCPVVNFAPGCGAGHVDIEDMLRLMAAFEIKWLEIIQNLTAESAYFTAHAI